MGCTLPSVGGGPCGVSNSPSYKQTVTFDVVAKDRYSEVTAKWVMRPSCHRTTSAAVVR